MGRQCGFDLLNLAFSQKVLKTDLDFGTLIRGKSTSKIPYTAVNLVHRSASKYRVPSIIVNLLSQVLFS